MKKKICLILILVNYINIFSQNISSFSPNMGFVGTSVTIIGSGFLPGGTTVKFDGIIAAVTSVTSGQIICTVPSGATCNKISVKVNGNPTEVFSTGYFKVTLNSAVQNYTTCFNTSLNIPVPKTYGTNSPVIVRWGAFDNLNTTGESLTTQTTTVINDIISTPGSTSQNVTYTVTETYTVGSCPATLRQVNVTLRAKPSINIVSSNSLLCSGQTASLNVSGANSYTWDSGSSSATLVVTPSITTTYTVIATDINNCKNTASFTQSVSTCTGLNPISFSNTELIIYPNPFKNFISISSHDNIQSVTIYNVVGSIIYHTNMPNKIIEIDLSNLSSGLYFIKIGSSTTKIIKE